MLRRQITVTIEVETSLSEAEMRERFERAWRGAEINATLGDALFADGRESIEVVGATISATE